MLELGSKFLLCYFIGSVMGSMVMGKLRGGVDIRALGSGNAGGTNALRTQGPMFALGVVIIDIGKGALATGIIPGLELPLVGIDPSISRVWLEICCAMAVVIGHVWPMYHNFKGGKGAATLVGTLLVLQPGLLLPTLGVWVLVVLATGYVGLATMAASVFVPVYLAFGLSIEIQPLFVFSVLMAAFMIFTHRANIQRMLTGEEHYNGRLALFKPRR